MSDFKGISAKKIAVIIIGVVVLAGGAFAVYQNTQNKMKAAVEKEIIYKGISIEKNDVGGLSKEQAKQVLLDNNKIAEMSVHLICSDKSFDIPYETMGAKYDIDGAIDAAYAIGRDGSLRERYKIVSDLLKTPMNIDIDFVYNEALIKNEVEKIKEEISCPAQDSAMERKNGKFIITDEKKGYDLNVPETIMKISNMIKNMETGDVEASVTVLEPKVTKEQNQKVTDLLGSYSTSFKGNDEGRNENLKVACENINGTIVGPGGTFSMNVELGPQTYANGYRDAGVIVNGKIEQDIAGGVCQVTTTLYNAVIFSELDVIERHNHSLTVGYVTLGRDAAVAGDYKDLKFKNNTEYPIYIEAYVGSGKVVTNIFGHETRSVGRKVEFEKVFVSSIPKPQEKTTESPDLFEGEREVTHNGKTGSKISTYKLIYENGKLISREWFSNSTYKATADEVTVGTKKRDSTPASASDNKEKPDLSNTESESTVPPIGGQ